MPRSYKNTFEKYNTSLWHENLCQLETFFRYKISKLSLKYSEALFIRDAFIRKHRYPDGFSREGKNST